MLPWQLFRSGAQIAWRRSRSCIFVYLISLVSAFLLAVSPALELLNSMRFPAMSEMLDGLDTWLIMEIFLSSVNRNGMGTITSHLFHPQIILATLLFIPMFSGLPNLLLAGPLANYLTPVPMTWNEMFRTSWRWLVSFTGLTFLTGLIGLIIAAILISLGFMLATWLDSWAWLLTALLAFVMYLVILTWIDLTKLLTVYQGRRNFFSQLCPALRIIFRHPWNSLGFVLLSLLVLATVIYGLNPLVLMWLPDHRWASILLLQQITIALRLLVHCIRWAGMSRLIIFDAGDQPHSGA